MTPRAIILTFTFSLSSCPLMANAAHSSPSVSATYTDSSQHSSSPTSIEQPAPTFYFGRYSFEVPTDGSGAWTSYRVVGKDIELISKDGKKDITVEVDETIAEINLLQKSGYPAFYKTVKLNGGSLIVISQSSSYDFNIYYLTEGNTLYRQSVASISKDSFDRSVEIAKNLNAFIHTRPDHVPPPPGGFAIESGYIALPLDTYPEQISIGLPVSTVPGIHLTFDTQKIGTPEPGLIARYDQRTSGFILPALQKVLSGSTILRKQKRQVAGLPFEELLLKTRSGGRTFWSFRLEYPGTRKSSMKPYTVLALSTLEEGATFNNDEEALKFWDALVESLQRT